MSQPVRGGSFKVKTETMMHSGKKGDDTKTGYGNFYLSFFKSKITTAQLILDLSKELEVEIEKEVCESVLRERDFYAKQIDENHNRKRKHDSLRNVDSPEKRMLTLFGANQSNTLVEHPVGYHIDVFGDQLSLECKKCFDLRPSEYVGRGGAGPGRYAFALLDWRGTTSATRRNEYLAATRQYPSDVPRVTEGMFAEHFGMSFEQYQASQQDRENEAGAEVYDETNVVHLGV